MDIYKVERIILGGRGGKSAEVILNSLAEQGYRIVKILPAGTNDAFVILELADKSFGIGFADSQPPEGKKKPGRPKKVQPPVEE